MNKCDENMIHILRGKFLGRFLELSEETIGEHGIIMNCMGYTENKI
jgi:hypothetical protein